MRHRTESGPSVLATIIGMDFHVGADGQLVTFPVQTRLERLALGESKFDLDVAYLPDSLFAIDPDCVLGMDVVEALQVSRFVLEPTVREIRLYG